MSNATINLIGRVVNEPEIREGKDQRKFVTFRLAVNNQFGASENAAFYNCTGNEFIANRVSKAGLKKGRLIRRVPLATKTICRCDGTTEHIRRDCEFESTCSPAFSVFQTN